MSRKSFAVKTWCMMHCNHLFIHSFTPLGFNEVYSFSQIILFFPQLPPTVKKQFKFHINFLFLWTLTSAVLMSELQSITVTTHKLRYAPRIMSWCCFSLIHPQTSIMQPCRCEMWSLLKPRQQLWRVSVTGGGTVGFFCFFMKCYIIWDDLNLRHDNPQFAVCKEARL